jgi:hypothetical protein
VRRPQCAKAAISGNLPLIAVFFVLEGTMNKFVRGALPALAFAGAMLAAAVSADAACISKGGKGTGGNVENAKFQAWEAVLQATDWGSWASFMSSGMKVGTAPGYKVSNLRSKCEPGGLGQVCIMSAKLCK